GARGRCWSPEPHQGRLVLGRDLLDVLVPDRDLIVGGQEPGEGREPEWRKERVLDRPEERTCRFGERREDHLHAHVNGPPPSAPGCNGSRSRGLRGPPDVTGAWSSASYS